MYSGLEISKILKSHLSTKWQKIVAKCKFLVAKSNRTQSIDIHEVLNAQGFAMHYRAISNRGNHFEVLERESQREPFTFVCLRKIKHGDPVGNQRIGFVLLYLFE